MSHIIANANHKSQRKVMSYMGIALSDKQPRKSNHFIMNEPIIGIAVVLRSKCLVFILL